MFLFKRQGGLIPQPLTRFHLKISHLSFCTGYPPSAWFFSYIGGMWSNLTLAKKEKNRRHISKGLQLHWYETCWVKQKIKVWELIRKVDNMECHYWNMWSFIVPNIMTRYPSIWQLFNESKEKYYRLDVNFFL